MQGHFYRRNRGSGWWQGQFKGCGYRFTFPRRLILDVLSSSSMHLSAEDVYLEVHKKYPGVGLATVYRTLELLVQMGVVSKSDFGDGRARYEMNKGPEGQRHHHHLVCSNCGLVIDYADFIDEEAKLLKKVERGLSEKYKFEINSHLMQFYGLCEKCKGKKD
ncbi:MAG: transcriptional repressor [Candidatus Omnitrophica bacterium]|nr:transcriptional repressor [Candidatus Omnitrophota bacterium]MDD5429494.1 transcriptional repressor [Candidatus Omnitrophota bacterium]